MSDTTPYLGQHIDTMLGQEFLTWLWYHSENNNGAFALDDDKAFNIYIESRIVVQGGEGSNLETATVSGSMSQLHEARHGLLAGKKVSRALIRIERNSESWQVSLKAEDFALGSLKTPTIEKGDSENDDPDARFLEKMYLVETFLKLIDEAYITFLATRLSPRWPEIARDVNIWMKISSMKQELQLKKEQI